MKKYIGVLFVFILVFHLCACGGGAENDYITNEVVSEIYSDDEIKAAIATITKEFRKKWSGCTLTEISYGGDEMSKEHQDWATRNSADEAIVLISSFDVDSSGGDGSLNPNSTYDNWMWILVRSDEGEWKHVDHGY